MASTPLFVTRAAFTAAMRTLIANFDPHLSEERTDDVEALYRRVFTDAGPLGDAPRDDLLKRAVYWLVDHRTERGMPRVAEIRAALDPMVDEAREMERGRRLVEQTIRLQREAAERGAAGRLGDG